MKRSVLVYAALALMLVTTNRVLAQGSLGVISMPGFPDLPADSAKEGQLYNFQVVVSNTTGSTIQGPITLMMRVDSTDVILDTINNPVSGSSTFTQGINNFSFTQPTFKTGNNIVVVWPVVNLSVAIDTFYTDVYFIPLLSNIEIEDPFGLTIYPNPATEFIYLESDGKSEISEAALFDIQGQLIRRFNDPARMINIEQVPTGMYFLYINYGGRQRYVRLMIQ